MPDVVLSQSLRELSPKQEQVLKVVEENFQNIYFSFGELKAKINFNPRTLRRYVKDFERDGLLEWNGEKGKGSRYILLDSSVPMSSMPIFVGKMRELLKNIEDRAKCPQLSSMSPIQSDRVDTTVIKDIEDNKGQNNLSSINSSNNKKLHQEMAIEDIRTGDIDKRNNHSEACDCEICYPNVDSWELVENT